MIKKNNIRARLSKSKVVFHFTLSWVKWSGVTEAIWSDPVLGSKICIFNQYGLPWSGIFLSVADELHSPLPAPSCCREGPGSRSMVPPQALISPSLPDSRQLPHTTFSKLYMVFPLMYSSIKVFNAPPYYSSFSLCIILFFRPCFVISLESLSFSRIFLNIYICHYTTSLHLLLPHYTLFLSFSLCVSLCVSISLNLLQINSKLHSR